MENHLQLTDQQFARQFRDGSLNPKLFTHEAHIRLAWIYLRQYGLEKAVGEVCNDIRAFDQLHGDGTKFHYTLTVAAVKTVNHFKQRSAADGFVDFIHGFPQLKYNFKGLLETHYSHYMLRLQRAKEEYLEPDLLPFS